MTVRLIATASLFALAQPALAGKTDEQPDPSDEIVVTAARTQLPESALPLTIDVIDSETLNRQVAISGSTVDAVSALLPSFSPTREKLSGAGESLRGRNVLYAINGIPQSTPVRDGSRDGYTIDPFFIDRVEVIYGSNALQGIGATGGVVNQVTVGAPREDGVTLRTELRGTADTAFTGEALGGKIGSLIGYRAGRFDGSIGAAFERRGVFLDGRGNRIGVDGTQGEIQDSDSWSVFARFGYELSPSARVEVIANRFSLEGNNNYVLVNGSRANGVPASSRRGTTPGKPPINRADLLSVSLTNTDLAGGAFILQGFYSRTRDVFGGGVFTTFQDPAIDPTGRLFDQSANQSRKLGGKVSYERAVPGLEDLVLTGGFDALFDRTEQTLVQTEREWVPQTDFRSLAPFVQANLALADGVVRLAGGARYESVQLKVGDYETLAANGATNLNDIRTFRRIAVAGGAPSFDKLLLNGGVIVEPLDGVRAYGSYAEGYTIADVGRILRAVSTDGVDIDDFLSLEPVISNNRELGIEVERGIVKGSASYFWSDSKLGSLLVLGLDGIFNVARQPIEIEGFETSLAVTIPPVPGLEFSLAYSHLQGRTDANRDGLLNEDLDGANISPDRLNLAVSYTAGPLDLRLASRHYLSRSFVGQPDPTAARFEGYTLFDAYVGLRTRLGEFLLAGQNLTDEYYITYDSDTVRTFDNARFFAGRGRTVTIGWRAEF
jgi:iron complex outermembrane receptor protein